MSRQLEILDGDEHARLAELEATVERGARTFIEVGSALRAIRDERLYRETHTSFGTYLRERWDMSRQHGYRLIDAAGVTGLLSPMGDTSDEHDDEDVRALAASYGFELPPDDGESETSAVADTPPPANERVARKLAATARKDPKRAKSIWAQAVKKHGPAATEADVAAIANGHPPEDGWEGDMRKLASSLRRVAKRKDPKAARTALQLWRPAYIHLDRIAKRDETDR